MIEDSGLLYKFIHAAAVPLLFANVPEASAQSAEEHIVTKCIGAESSVERIDSCTAVLRISNLAPDKRAAAHWHRGQAHLFLAKRELAFADANEAIRLDPQQADYFILRGRSRVGTDWREQAIADFTKAISLDPASEAAYRERGNMHNLLDNAAERDADRAAAKRLSPYSKKPAH